MPSHCISCTVTFHTCHQRKTQWHPFLALFWGLQQQRWECHSCEKGRVGREEEGKGGVTCPVSGCGFWALGFWAVPNQHKGDCSDCFLDNWNPTSYLYFWILNWVGYKKKQALHGLCPLSSAVVNILSNPGRRCHLPWLKWMIGIRYWINSVTSVTSKLPISPVHIVTNTLFSHSKNMNLLVPPDFEETGSHCSLWV